MMRLFLLLVSLSISTACGGGANTLNNNSNRSPANTAKAGPLPVYGYEVVKSYPHDPKAFTEGLFYHDGFLYESTGEKGHSQLRKVDLETGKVVQKWDLPPDEFGEGIAMIGDRIYQLTWQDYVGRVFDAKDFKL